MSGLLGPKIILQLSTSFMPAAVNDCLLSLRQMGAFPGGRQSQRAHQLSDDYRLNLEATTRFLNAATTVGLLERENGHYSYRGEAVVADKIASDAIFWIIRSNANLIFLDPVLSSAEKKIKLKNLENSEVMIAASIRHGILSETANGLEISSEIKKYLDPASDAYMGLWIRNYDRVASRIFTGPLLMNALRTGKTQWPQAFGTKVTNPFDLAIERPDIFEDLMRGMHQANVLDGELFLNTQNLSGVKRVLDVGGASGGWAVSFAKSIPTVESVDIYELASAIPLYKRIYKSVDDKHKYPIHYLPGDFFAHPENAFLHGLSEKSKYDVIALGWILHDWQDAEALTILKKLRSHMKKDSKLLVAEAIMPDNRLGTATFLDLTMLLQTGGKERTRYEYEDLFSRAGLRLSNIHDVGTRRSLMVVEPR